MTEKRRTLVKCFWCGCLFEKRPSDLKKSKYGRHYCSKECRMKGVPQFIAMAMKGNPGAIRNGKNNSKHLRKYYSLGNKPFNFSEVGKQLACAQCNIIFNVHPHKIKEGKAKYCSQKCYDKARSNPNRSEDLKARFVLDYKIWRSSVFERDKYTCQNCNVVGGRLHAHHIKRFSEYPELRFCLDNGKTLCVSCHYKIHPRKGVFSNVSNM